MEFFENIFQGGKDDSEIVREVLIRSYQHLIENNVGLTTADLDAEIINLASYIYLKDSDDIDFELEYLDQTNIGSLDGYSFEIVDQIIDGAHELFSKFYKESNVIIAKEGVRVNIQLADDYGSFLKSYFISKHKIGDGNDYQTFSSPKNSLWINGSPTNSPTQRDVNYKFDFDQKTFEVLINPYNPLVVGSIVTRTAEEVSCISNDEKRKFDFLYNNGDLYEIVMHRIDKGDIVKYHR